MRSCLPRTGAAKAPAGAGGPAATHCRARGRWRRPLRRRPGCSFAACASPPHSPSSGMTSVLPSPSQLGSSASGVGGGLGFALPTRCGTACSRRTRFRGRPPAPACRPGPARIPRAALRRGSPPGTGCRRASARLPATARAWTAAAAGSTAAAAASAPDAGRHEAIDPASCGFRRHWALQPHHHMRKCSPRYTRRTSALFTISEGVPCASTLPSLMM